MDDLIRRFRDYQIEWLTAHNDIEFCEEEEKLIIGFLKDTAESFVRENQSAKMDDLISRQAAMAYPLSWEHYDKEHGNRHFICGVESYREYIESLPSAQQWIPCSERLPEKIGDYLVSVKRHGWNCEEYIENDIAYWDDLEGFHKAEEVLAWMPLPEPYREEVSD